MRFLDPPKDSRGASSGMRAKVCRCRWYGLAQACADQPWLRESGVVSRRTERRVLVHPAGRPAVLGGLPERYATILVPLLTLLAASSTPTPRRAALVCRDCIPRVWRVDTFSPCPLGKASARQLSRAALKNFGAAARFVSYAGSSMVTFVPLPTSLSMRIVPPWASTIWRAMARPRPVPPESRERALSTR